MKGYKTKKNIHSTRQVIQPFDYLKVKLDKMLYNIKNKYNQAHKEKWEMPSISHFHLNFIEPIHLAILLPRP